MKSRLAGRVVLITGAASGIGRATALRCASEGATVAGIDVDAEGLAATLAEVRSVGPDMTAVVADVGDRNALAAAIQSIAAAAGPLHGVFANAGILPAPTSLDQLDWAEWDRVLQVDLTAAVMTLVEASKHVADGGSLVATGSSMAIRPRPQRLAYVAAKAGLHAAARALALELAPRRIRVNVVAPGLTDTPMVAAIPGHVESGLPSVPLGELVPADEVAAVVAHLMSDDARHMTGGVVSIDGGRTAG